MKKHLLLLMLMAKALLSSSQILSFSIVSTPSNFAISCSNPTVNLKVISLPGGAVLNFTCVGGSSGISTGTNVPITSPGSYTLIFNPGTATISMPLSILANTVAPVISSSPSMQAGGTAASVFTISSLFPTTNITQYVYSPNGGIYTVNTATATYIAGSTGTYTHCVTDNTNGCTSCNQFTLNTGVGLKSQSILNTVVLYPNPAQNLLYVNTTPTLAGMSCRYELINVAGQCVWTGESSEARMTINLEPFKNGMYLLRVSKDGEGVKVLRVVIQK
ncbi:MAG: T9SS type A sorting domain-containing protein [Bacteroidia bacterium]|nr:T9SS type A sorting domain-containing protein [Bacteroidia bacterium]